MARIQPPRSWRALLLDDDGFLELNKLIALIIRNSTKDVYLVTDQLKAYPSQCRPSPFERDLPVIDMSCSPVTHYPDKQFIFLPPGYVVGYNQRQVLSIGGYGCLETASRDSKRTLYDPLGPSLVGLQGRCKECVEDQLGIIVAIDYDAILSPAKIPRYDIHHNLSANCSENLDNSWAMLEEGVPFHVGERGLPHSCWEAHFVVAPPGFKAGYDGHSLTHFFKPLRAPNARRWLM